MEGLRLPSAGTTRALDIGDRRGASGIELVGPCNGGLGGIDAQGGNSRRAAMKSRSPRSHELLRATTVEGESSVQQHGICSQCMH